MEQTQMDLQSTNTHRQIQMIGWMQQTENSAPALTAKGLQKKKKAPQCNVEDCQDLAEIILDLQRKQ